MSKVENLERIIEKYGPHLHDAPADGWLADRTIDRVVPTHCPYCAVQCGMNLLVEEDKVVGFEPRYDFPVNEGRLCPKGVTAYLQIHHPDRLKHLGLGHGEQPERDCEDQEVADGICLQGPRRVDREWIADKAEDEIGQEERGEQLMEIRNARTARIADQHESDEWEHDGR